MLYSPAIVLPVVMLLWPLFANGQITRLQDVNGKFPRLTLKPSAQPALGGAPAPSSEHKTPWKSPEDVVSYEVQFNKFSTKDNGDPDFTSSYNYLMTILEVEEYIYHTLLNSDIAAKEPLPSFYFPAAAPLPFNITAVGRGLEKDLPFTFTVDHLVHFMTFLGLTDVPFRWLEFEFVIVVDERAGYEHNVESVAVGRFEPIIFKPDDGGSPDKPFLKIL